MFEDSVDQAVAQFLGVPGAKVAAKPGWGTLVSHRLQHRIRHRAKGVGRGSQLTDGSQRRLAGVRVPTPTSHHGDNLATSEIDGHEWCRWRRHHCGEGGELIREASRPGAVRAQYLRAAIDWKEGEPAQDRADGMQVELQAGDDAEVAAAAAQPPEQFGRLCAAGAHDLARRKYDLGADEVVTGEAVLPLEPPDAAAKR